MLHGIQRLVDFHLFAVHKHLAAGLLIGAEYGADAFAAAGTQQTGETVDLTLVDVEVKGLDALRAAEALCLQHRRAQIHQCRIAVILDGGHVVQLFTQHLGNQLHPGQILNDILANQLTVPQNRNAVADLVNLIQEVGNKDDAHALCLQVPHQLKQLFHFLLVQRGGGLVQNQDLTVHIHCPGNGHHLLHGNGAAAQLLGGYCRNIQGFQELSGPFVHLLPVGQGAPGSAYIHILRHRQIGAEGNFLINRADARVLGILRRADRNRSFVALDKDLTAVLFIDAGKHFDQGGFAGAVFAHQRVDLALSQSKIHILQSLNAGEVFANAAHFQYCAVLHIVLPPFSVP